MNPVPLSSPSNGSLELDEQSFPAESSIHDHCAVVSLLSEAVSSVDEELNGLLLHAETQSQSSEPSSSFAGENDEFRIPPPSLPQVFIQEVNNDQISPEISMQSTPEHQHDDDEWTPQNNTPLETPQETVVVPKVLFPAPKKKFVLYDDVGSSSSSYLTIKEPPPRGDGLNRLAPVLSRSSVKSPSSVFHPAFSTPVSAIRTRPSVSSLVPPPPPRFPSLFSTRQTSTPPPPPVHSAAQRTSRFEFKTPFAAANVVPPSLFVSPSVTAAQPVTVDVPSMFQTGSGRQLRVSRTALARATEAILQEEPNSSGVSLALPHDEPSRQLPSSSSTVKSMFSTGSGKSVSISQTSLNRASTLLESSALTCPDVSTPFNLVKTTVEPIRAPTEDSMSHVAVETIIGAQEETIACDIKVESIEETTNPGNDCLVLKNKMGQRLRLPPLRIPISSLSHSSPLLLVTSSNAICVSFALDPLDVLLSDSPCYWTLQTLRSQLPPCPLDWVANHFRWIVWKLACQDRLGLGTTKLTLSSVLDQLKKRFDTEFTRGKQSALTKVIRQTLPLTSPVVLMISRIFSDSLVEVSDGWYGMEASLDAGLRQALVRGRLRIGQKFVTTRCLVRNPCQSALTLMTELTCNKWLSPSSSSRTTLHHQPCLMLSKEYSHPVSWDSRLGVRTHEFVISTWLSKLSLNNSSLTSAAMVFVFRKSFPVVTDQGEEVVRMMVCDAKRSSPVTLTCAVETSACVKEGQAYAVKGLERNSMGLLKASRESTWTALSLPKNKQDLFDFRPRSFVYCQDACSPNELIDTIFVWIYRHQSTAYVLQPTGNDGYSVITLVFPASSVHRSIRFPSGTVVCARDLLIKTPDTAHVIDMSSFTTAIHEVEFTDQFEKVLEWSQNEAAEEIRVKLLSQYHVVKLGMNFSALSHLMVGRKRVDVRREIADLQVGTKIRYEAGSASFQEVRVTRIQPYANYEELLRGEGFKNVSPWAPDFAHAMLEWNSHVDMVVHAIAFEVLDVFPTSDAMVFPSSAKKPRLVVSI